MGPTRIEGIIPALGGGTTWKTKKKKEK